jgi:hypothetical protein
MLVLVYLEIVLIMTQDCCMVYAERTIGLEIILTHPMVLLGDEAHVDDHFGPFRDSANLTQDRCMVWVEHTIRLEIVVGCTRWIL